MQNIVTPCGEGRVTTRSCEGLAQAGSTFPGRKRIVKSNTESNRVESEGPARVPCCTSWLTVEPSASGAPGRERTQDAGRCILHICMFYVSVHSAFAPLPHPRVLSLSLLLSPPASHSVLPFSATCTARLFFSLNPALLVSRLSSFLSFLRLHPRFANRETAMVSTNSEKLTLAPKKGNPGGGKARYNIASVCLIDRLSR